MTSIKSNLKAIGGLLKWYLQTPKNMIKWSCKVKKLYIIIMFKRHIDPPKNKSFFLFGPRGTGKTTWLKTNYKQAIYINLLEAQTFNNLLAGPERLQSYIPDKFNDWVILDEVQKIPELLDEVHRLIEEKKYKFILTGSSARKLKNKNVNLLAGRALTYKMYPLTSQELGNAFDLEKSLTNGNMPATYNEEDVRKYLESYLMTYLEQEVKQEGLTRNLGAFSRFLEVASFSQGSVLNISEIARECAIHRKVAENYFSILEDLLIAYFLPSFTKRAKRKNVKHNKFYYFDAGVYRTIRPRGPLDYTEEIDGASLETLLLQELMAMNEYHNFNYSLYFWRTISGEEVDFILYGEQGILAIEIKRRKRITPKDLKGLRLFLQDYPGTKAYLVYGGDKTLHEKEITILPIKKFFKNIKPVLSNNF